MKLSLMSWPEISVRNKLIIICSGTLIVLISVYFFLCKPKALATESLKDRARQQQTALENAQRELQDMPDLEGYYRQLQEEEARVKSLLPDSEDITDLLVALNALSKEQHVKIAGIKQGAFVDRKTYYEIPLEIAVTGTYPDLLRFINKMETVRRFNSITKIGAHAEENLVTMQLSTVVYAYGAIPPSLQAKPK